MPVAVVEFPGAAVFVEGYPGTTTLYASAYGAVYSEVLEVRCTPLEWVVRVRTAEGEDARRGAVAFDGSWVSDGAVRPLGVGVPTPASRVCQFPYPDARLADDEAGGVVVTCEMLSPEHAATLRAAPCDPCRQHCGIVWKSDGSLQSIVCAKCQAAADTTCSACAGACPADGFGRPAACGRCAGAVGADCWGCGDPSVYSRLAGTGPPLCGRCAAGGRCARCEEPTFFDEYAGAVPALCRSCVPHGECRECGKHTFFNERNQAPAPLCNGCIPRGECRGCAGSTFHDDALGRIADLCAVCRHAEHARSACAVCGKRTFVYGDGFVAPRCYRHKFANPRHAATRPPHETARALPPGSQPEPKSKTKRRRQVLARAKAKAYEQSLAAR
jgi:hypothetical protein